MREFPADVYGGARRMVTTLIVGLLGTGALAGAAHLLALPSGLLGGIAVVGVIGTQISVMLNLRKQPATLAFDGRRLLLRKGATELRASPAWPIGFARYVVAQVGVMGQALVFGSLTVAVIRSGLVGNTTAADVTKPDCFVTSEVFDELAAMLRAPVDRQPTAATITRFTIFANQASTGSVLKTLGYMWLVVMPLTAGGSLLADLWLPSPYPAVVAVVAFVLSGSAGIALLLRKRERTVALENGSISVIDGGRLVQSGLLAAVSVKRVQHDIRAKSMHYKLTGIAVRFPDGSELRVASRVPGTWPGGVDEIKRGEPGWLMGPAELPVFAGQLGIQDSPAAEAW